MKETGNRFTVRKQITQVITIPTLKLFAACNKVVIVYSMDHGSKSYLCDAIKQISLNSRRRRNNLVLYLIKYCMPTLQMA